SARAMYRFTTFGTPSFYDGIGVIWPRCGLTTGSNADLPQTIQVLRPVQLTSKSFPMVQSFSTPTGGTVRDQCMSGRMTEYYYITGPVGATPTELFRFDPSTGASTQITGFSNPTRVVSGRKNQIYVLDSGAIIYYDVEHPPTTGAPPSTTSQAIDAMA